MDDPDSDNGGDVPMEDVKQDDEGFKDDGPGIYQLKSFITHLGVSVHCGHYVAHVRKDGQWVYYNDIKVCQTNDPPIGKGYVYFLSKNKSA